VVTFDEVGKAIRRHMYKQIAPNKFTGFNPLTAKYNYKLQKVILNSACIKQT
jgi:hypothetical protein